MEIYIKVRRKRIVLITRPYQNRTDFIMKEGEG